MSALGSTAARRLGVIGCAAVSAVVIGACGVNHKLPHPHYADNPAVYVNAGGVTYQVQISRQLNQYAAEDHSYLAGVAPSQLPIAPDQLWFGVFLWAKNQTHLTLTTSDTFTIRDSAGRVYYPTPIASYSNPWAWSARRLQPGGTEPAVDTMAFYGPTQGSLVLFKLYDSIYSNRPLTLNIYAAGQAFPTRVSLDL
jgi:hypothetical protein